MATNADRTAAAKGRLIEAARSLFGSQGYAATSTDAILKQAGVQRGAMYHHFRDKADLFEAVCVHLSMEAMQRVEAVVDVQSSILDALIEGSIAWIEFSLETEIRQILIIDAPTVLGWERWETLDYDYSFRLFVEGVHKAIEEGVLVFDGTADALATALSGAINSLALSAGAKDTPMPDEVWRPATRSLFKAFASEKAVK